MKKFVYKNQEAMEAMYAFYDKALQRLAVNYEETYVNTPYGETHILIIGDKRKPKLFTLHGGNGITPLNVRLFKPLLTTHCIIAPDVPGMPGKSAPYRTFKGSGEDYGYWMDDIMEKLQLDRASFVVSSYSAAMFLSLAKTHPERIRNAVLLVPSGIAHGHLLPILCNMAVPFTKYYIHPTKSNLGQIMQTMVSDADEEWEEFLHLMMSGYKMEMRAPKEYKAKELISFLAPVFVIASVNDIFFPAERIFAKLPRLFQGSIKMVTIEDKHLPSQKTIEGLCAAISDFLLTEYRTEEIRKLV